jgi:predicted regulator of Ras-like GTPase activity (Roadblock/LC7/MglB family)
LNISAKPRVPLMFVDRLNEIKRRIEGTVALALVARDGMQVESISSNSDIDLEVLSAELMTQVRAISQNHQELSVGSVRHLSVITDRMVMMVSAVADDYFLLLVLEPGANTGKARFELRRSKLAFEGDL